MSNLFLQGDILRSALLFVILIGLAGCDPRSSSLPTTDKWVRFHCPGKASDKHVCMVELPGKPQLATHSLYDQLRSGNGKLDYYSYACGSDGEYGVGIGIVPEEDQEPPLTPEELQELGNEIAERMEATLSSNTPFLMDGQYPALDLAGEKKRGLYGKFRARIVYKRQHAILLLATGRSSVVRDQEVDYFFDSLLLYK